MCLDVWGYVSVYAYVCVCMGNGVCACEVLCIYLHSFHMHFSYTSGYHPVSFPFSLKDFL
jgi:hypothetical protein